MSSIYGKINFDRKPIELDELGRMRAALNHWDTDDNGMWYDGCVGLGQMMLWNTPESLKEKLPLYDNNSLLTITADARIDNRDELFGKLALSKIANPEVPDSVLILKCYEKYGEDCVLHLIGDFAFAIWDQKEQKLFCARDHTGVRPFFYYHCEHFFAFATEPKGLLTIENINKEISDDYFLKLAAHFSPEKKQTAYRHIFRLEPASCFTIQNGQLKARKYWELDASKEIIYKESSEYIEHFRELFTKAVGSRIRSAFLIGSELSGGLDSSGISAVAANLLHAQGAQIAAFVALHAPAEVYKDPKEREEYFVDEVVNFSGIDFVDKRYENFEPDEFLRCIDDRLSVYGYPAFAAYWHHYYYKNAANRGVRTILSGHGGDQLVTDYSSEYILQYLNDKQYQTYFNLAVKQWGFARAIKKIISVHINTPPPSILNSFLLSMQKSKFRSNSFNFLTADYFRRIEKQFVPHGFVANFKEVQKENISRNFISDRMEFETINGLQYKISPAFPMQDIRLMEFVLAIPTYQKMSPGRNRLLFRNAMKGVLPDTLVNKKEKHYPPLVSPRQQSWLARQSLVKHWLDQLHQNKRIAPFINYPKLINGYTWNPDSNVPFGKLMIAKREQLELIIRFFETNT